MTVLDQVLARLETAVLDTPQTLTTTYREQLERLAVGYNMRRAGGGQAEILMPEGRNYVYRAWISDTGYETWLDYAVRHQSNPFVPKILSRVRVLPYQFKRMPSDLQIKFVKLERLAPIGTTLARIVDEFAGGWTRDEIEPLLDRSPQYIEFFDWMYLMRRELGFNDVNDDNVMMRGPTPVLIDPIKD